MGNELRVDGVKLILAEMMWGLKRQSALREPLRGRDKSLQRIEKAISILENLFPQDDDRVDIALAGWDIADSSRAIKHSADHIAPQARKFAQKKPYSMLVVVNCDIHLA